MATTSAICDGAGIKITHDRHSNQICVSFPHKPSPYVQDNLRSQGLTRRNRTEGRKWYIIYQFDRWQRVHLLLDVPIVPPNVIDRAVKRLKSEADDESVLTLKSANGRRYGFVEVINGSFSWLSTGLFSGDGLVLEAVRYRADGTESLRSIQVADRVYQVYELEEVS